MTGVSFTIPVTLELVEVVRRGEYPATPTVVAMRRPEVPRPPAGLSRAVRELETTQCFEESFVTNLLGRRLCRSRFAIKSYYLVCYITTYFRLTYYTVLCFGV